MRRVALAVLLAVGCAGPASAGPTGAKGVTDATFEFLRGTIHRLRGAGRECTAECPRGQVCDTGAGECVADGPLTPPETASPDAPRTSTLEKP